MTERDPEIRMTKKRAGCDQARGSECNLTRKSDNLLKHRWANQALLARRAQSVNEHGHTESGGSFEERLEARIADRHPVDIAADFHGTKAQQFNVAVEFHDG